MAGYRKIFCIGGEGGHLGSDGINPILFQIFVGDASRQWLEVNYVDTAIKPIGKIKTIVPRGPDHRDSLIDACLAFYPKFFESCPSLPAVKEKLNDAERMDFDMGENVPAEWAQLREEARPLMNKLAIFRADLVPVET